MYKVKTLNHVSPVCMKVMTEDRYTISDDMQDPDAIFVRATDMHNYEFNPSLRCIARAASSYSIPRAATPTPSRSCSCLVWVWPPAI